MFILFFACWVIFNQSFTLEIALFGVVISLALYIFCCKFMGFSIQKDIFIVRKIPLIFAYILILLKEVIKANFVLFRIFATKKGKREPVIISFHTSLKTEMAKALLANAITLTPGTITVKLEGDMYTIHCFDKSLAVGIDDTVFERMLSKLERGYEG